MPSNRVNTCLRAVLLAILFLSVNAASSQSAQQIPDTLLDSLKVQLSGKTLVLRTYAAASWATYKVEGDHLQPQEHLGHKLSVFDVKSVTQAAHSLEIYGTRKSYVRLQGTRKLAGYPAETPMWLHIDLEGVTDFANLLQRVPADLFFFNLQEGYAAIPSELLGCTVQEYSEKTQEIVHNPACEVAVVDGVLQPRLLEPRKPQLPGWILKGENYVLLHFIVGTNGRVTGVEVLKSTSADMAKQALAVIKNYKFEPASRDGKKIDYPFSFMFHFSA